MTVKLSSLKADLEREEKGDWVEHPDWEGVAFKVSSLLLPKFQTKRSLLYQRWGRTYKNKPVPRDVMSAEMGGLYADLILHDWRGLDEAYSPERAREILTDPSYRNIVAAIEYCAAKLSDVDVEFVDTELGNSSKPSANA
jgi:hypothetical protein